MGLKKWVKKKAKSAKKGVEKTAGKAKNAAEDAAKKAKREAERKAREAKELAERKARDAKRAAERLKRETEEKIAKATDPVERIALAAEQAIREGLSEMDVKKLIEGEVKKLRGSVKREILDELKEHVAEPVEAFVTDKLPDLIGRQAPRLAVKLAEEGLEAAQNVAMELQRAVAKPGLVAARKLLQTTYDGMAGVPDELKGYLDTPGFTLRLGPVAMTWSAFFSRGESILKVLDGYCDKPPAFRRSDLRTFLEGLGPDEIEIDASVKANVLFVGSSVMEVEAAVPTIPFALGTYILDEILEAAGVPE